MANANSVENLGELPARTSPLPAGPFAPAFRLRNLFGEPFASIDLIAKGPLVVSFYRGSWCDFCDIALERLSDLDPGIRDLGAGQVAIGPPPAKDAQRERLAALRVPVLVDPSLEVTQAYGLVSRVPPAERERYVAFGYPRPKPGNGAPWSITIPGTYVINAHGRVAMAATDSDYRKRMTGPEILAVLRALAAHAPA